MGRITTQEIDFLQREIINLMSGVPPIVVPWEDKQMSIELTKLNEWSKLLNNLETVRNLMRAAGFIGKVKLLNSDKTLYITFKLPQSAGFADKSDFPKMLRAVADVLELNIKSEIEE